MYRVGAGGLAVVIIADVDDQVAVSGGGARGNPGEGKLRGVVARLRRLAGCLDAAAGVDSGRAIAFNGRCWARSMLDRDLDKALGD